MAAYYIPAFVVLGIFLLFQALDVPMAGWAPLLYCLPIVLFGAAMFGCLAAGWPVIFTVILGALFVASSLLYVYKARKEVQDL